MILSIVIVSVIILTAIISSICESRIKKEKISFKEAMDLVELPVITFYMGDSKLNFLLDTGSNRSFIDPKASHLLTECKKEKEDLSITGCGGKAEAFSKYLATLIYKGKLFEVELWENPGLTEAFAAIKQSDGVQIHGILGSLFFQKYKYVLDFKELAAYQK